MKIKYLLFQKLQNEIKDQESNELFVRSKIADIFFKGVNTDKNIDKFNKALSDKSIKLNFNIDFNFKTAERFIDCDTYFTRGQYIEFLSLVVKKKYFWQSDILKNISLRDAEYVINLFIYAREILKSDTNGSITPL